MERSNSYQVRSEDNRRRSFRREVEFSLSTKCCQQLHQNHDLFLNLNEDNWVAASKQLVVVQLIGDALAREIATDADKVRMRAHIPISNTRTIAPSVIRTRRINLEFCCRWGDLS